MHSAHYSQYLLCFRYGGYGQQSKHRHGSDYDYYDDFSYRRRAGPGLVDSEYSVTVSGVLDSHFRNQIL